MAIDIPGAISSACFKGLFVHRFAFKARPALCAAPGMYGHVCCIREKTREKYYAVRDRALETALQKTILAVLGLIPYAIL